MDIQTAIDRITEIESLTDEMDDETASWIIDWAIAKLREMLPRMTDETQFADKTDDMIALVKQLNYLTSLIDRKNTGALPEGITRFAAAYEKTFGHAQPLDPAQAAAAIAPESPRTAMEHLLQKVAPPEPLTGTLGNGGTGSPNAQADAPVAPNRD